MHTSPATLTPLTPPARSSALPLHATDATVAAWTLAAALALAVAAADAADVVLYGSTRSAAPDLDATGRSAALAVAAVAEQLRTAALRRRPEALGALAGELAALAAGLSAVLARRGVRDDAGEDLSAALASATLAAAALVRALEARSRRGSALATLRAHEALRAPLGGRGLPAPTVAELAGEASL